MKIERVPFTHVLWTAQPSIESRGEAGSAFSKTMSAGNVCVRMVEYSPGYRAGHWCAKGHVVLLLEGLLTIVLEDGRSFQMAAGDSFQVGDDDGRHRAYTDIGAKLFIVD